LKTKIDINYILNSFCYLRQNTSVVSPTDQLVTVV